jgi:hypothetical protein
MNSFQPQNVIEPFYTGGKVSQAKDGTLATTLGEHVLITRSPHNPETLRIPGVIFRIIKILMGQGYGINNYISPCPLCCLLNNLFTVSYNANLFHPLRKLNSFRKTA